MRSSPTEEDENMSDCLFCKIVSGDIPGDIVFQDDEIVAFNDINPQAPVHILIIPKKHIATHNDLSDDDAQLIGSLLLKIKNIAQGIDQLSKGYRIVTNCDSESGQSVFHVHFHLLGGRPMHWPPG
jgi:histidine triad (HIT) family protein